MHTGIYGPLSTDARSESAAAAQGGVTSMINYIRTGQYYLNESGPYSEFFPKVLEQSDGNYFVDYAYHLAPMMGEHIDEIEMLIEKYGVLSFKILKVVHPPRVAKKEELSLWDYFGKQGKYCVKEVLGGA